MNRFHWMSYQLTHGHREDAKVHRVRDGAAFAQIAPALSDLGYSFGRLILNCGAEAAAISDHNEADPTHADEQVVKGDDSHGEGFDDGDVILLCTRPPISDHITDKKIIRRSFGWIEAQIFHALRSRVFEFCNNKHVVLGTKVALTAEWMDRRNVGFRQNKGGQADHVRGTYMEFLKTPFGKPVSAPSSHQSMTLAYIVHLPAIWQDGPSLLCAFGMDGNHTLVLASMIRDQFSEKLGELVRNQHTAAVMLVEIDCKQTVHNPSSIDEFLSHFSVVRSSIFEIDE